MKAETVLRALIRAVEQRQVMLLVSYTGWRKRQRQVVKFAKWLHNRLGEVGDE